MKFKRTRKYIAVLVVSILFFSPILSAAVEVAPKITDREIVERLVGLEKGQEAIIRELDKQFEAIDKRFEAIDKRFDVIDKRFDAVDKRVDKQFEAVDIQFNRMHQLILGILGAFVALSVGTIGFALWDRRTMVRPFEVKITAIENEISTHRDKLHALIEAFRSLGQTDKKAAEILKRFNLL